MKNYPNYWGVIRIDFLKVGNFTTTKRDIAREWCKHNCIGKFISSDLYPWAFLKEEDAKKFALTCNGIVVYKGM